MGKIYPRTDLIEEEENKKKLDNSKMDKSFNNKKNKIKTDLANKLRADFQRLKRYFNLSENLTSKQFKETEVYKGNN